MTKYISRLNEEEDMTYKESIECVLKKNAVDVKNAVGAVKKDKNSQTAKNKNKTKYVVEGELTPFGTRANLEKHLMETCTEESANAEPKKAVVSDTCPKLNVQATKEEERKALAQIKKIVSNLGEGSYISIALDGCLEDAEVNIRDDAAYSMKSRLECTVKQLHSADRKIEKLENEIKTLKSVQLSDCDLMKLIEQLKEENKILKTNQFSNDDLTNILQLITDKQSNLEGEIKKASDDIVKYADDPTSVEFQQAVKDHRSAACKAEYYNKLRKKVYDVKK